MRWKFSSYIYKWFILLGVLSTAFLMCVRVREAWKWKIFHVNSWGKTSTQRKRERASQMANCVWMFGDNKMWALELGFLFLILSDTRTWDCAATTTTTRACRNRREKMTWWSEGSANNNKLRLGTRNDSPERKSGILNLTIKFNVKMKGKEQKFSRQIISLFLHSSREHSSAPFSALLAISMISSLECFSSSLIFSLISNYLW